MRTVLGITAALSLLSLTGVAHADPCADIVDDTIAELRAGAGSRWSDEAEGLARAAAGSACIKAVSGRYADGVGVSVTDEPVAAKATAAEENDDSGTWSLGGLTVRGMSGSPSKKPYQRERVDKDKDSE